MAKAGKGQHAAQIGLAETEQADHQHAGMADDGKGQQSPQVDLHQRQRCRVENTGGCKGCHPFMPAQDRFLQQREHEPNQGIDTGLQPQQEDAGNGDGAVYCDQGQPAMQGKQRDANPQAIEQQEKDYALDFQRHRMQRQFMQVKTPLPVAGVRVVPAQHEGASQQQQQADAHELQVALHGGFMLRRLGSALQQVGDQDQFHGGQQGERQQVLGREHALQCGLDGEYHGQEG
jgi:hypothetical protein